MTVNYDVHLSMDLERASSVKTLLQLFVLDRPTLLSVLILPHTIKSFFPPLWPTQTEEPNTNEMLQVGYTQQQYIDRWVP